MLSIISPASNFPLSKLNLGDSQTEQENIVPWHSGNFPLEHASTSSIPRGSLEEDEDESLKEKILTTTFIGSDFRRSLHSSQNVFETLGLEILTPPPQK